LKGKIMSEENTIIEEETVETVQQEAEQPEAPEAKTDEVDPIEAAVQDRLQQMKQNMDRMVRERDEALKKAAEVEQAQKAAEIERLEAEGKLKEALEMKLAEANAKLKVFEEENTKLNRDNVVNTQLATLEFRNERSRQMAQRDIVEQLVQNENGAWVHKSGSSIQEFIDSYSKSEDNSFLFRVKANSGAGTATPSAPSQTEVPKSLSEMTSEEVLAMAAKGQLGQFNY
jgi:DNA polymerase III gamma/tau subunit